MMKDYYLSVPGWAAFTPLYAHMVDKAKGGAHFVEIGSWLGRSACFMAEAIEESGKKIQFDCIDPWIDGGPDLRDTDHFKRLKNHLYVQFQENIKPFAHMIKPVRATSVQAAEFYEDHCLDFIMIDGDHSYSSVKSDIMTWLPKMKDGAIMSGDDYGWPGVTQAVQESFGNRAQVTWVHKAADYKMSASYWVVRCDH